MFVVEFFAKNGVATMTVKELFDFITDISITQDDVERYLDKLEQKLQTREPLTAEQIVDEEVFKKVYIPKTLEEVKYCFKDLGFRSIVTSI